MMATDQTEEQEDAVALLARCRHKLTGREEAICERIASGECSEDPMLVVEEQEGDFACFTDPEQFAGYPTADEQPLFDSLKTQFAREIAAWKDGVRA